MFRRVGFALAGAVVLSGGAQQAGACATCLGAPDAAMTQGLNMGILTLLLVVLAVLGGAAALFLHLAKRAASNPLAPEFQEGHDGPPSPFKAH